MASLSQLDICNLALAHLPAAPIASINENSLEARECRRFYPHSVADALEKSDWSFANTRVGLAELATNDRDSEWLYAYGLPSNMGSALRVLPDFEGLGLGLPTPLAGDPYAETWSTMGGNYYETPYVIQGSTLYSNIETATLEYSINDVAGINVPQLFHTAMVLDLAARLAVPVKKDSNREAALLKAADAKWQEAIADDRNRHPHYYGQYVSEGLMARRGYVSELG